LPHFSFSAWQISIKPLGLVDLDALFLLLGGKIALR